MRILILGGTRFLGPRLARALLQGGAAVTLLHRGVTVASVDGARTVVGDRSLPEGLDGLGDERFDVVVDFSAYASDWTRASVQRLAGRVAHYLFISSGAVYRPGGELGWPESTPFGPMPIWGRYGQEKVASERLLWEAHASGSFAVTVFRLPFVLGPANFVDRESFVLSRIETHRPILLAGEGRSVNQFVFVDDVVRALVAAIERRDRSAGEAFNCAYPRGITNRGFVEQCADVLGLDAQIIPIDAEALGVASDTVDLTDLVFPFPDQHYLLDPGKIERELDVVARVSNRQMIEAFVDWWLAGGRVPPRPYPRENHALGQRGQPLIPNSPA